MSRPQAVKCTIKEFLSIKGKHGSLRQPAVCQITDGGNVIQFIPSYYTEITYVTTRDNQRIRLCAPRHMNADVRPPYECNKYLKEIWIEEDHCRCDIFEYTFKRAGTHIVKFLFKQHGGRNCSIPTGCFGGNDYIKSVKISDQITHINSGAFYMCKNLESVILGNNVKIIRRDAFRHCTSLTNIDLRNIENIRCGAFFNCSSLRNLYLPDTLSSTGYNCFAYSGVQKVKIPIVSTFNTISLQMFYNCQNLTEIEIPDNIQSIAPRAFMKCYNLKTVNISSAESGLIVMDYAFDSCYNLDPILTSRDLIIDEEDCVFRRCPKIIGDF